VAPVAVLDAVLVNQRCAGGGHRVASVRMWAPIFSTAVIVQASTVDHPQVHTVNARQRVPSGLGIRLIAMRRSVRVVMTRSPLQPTSQCRPPSRVSVGAGSVVVMSWESVRSMLFGAGVTLALYVAFIAVMCVVNSH
jgi:hypothetical protein